MWEVELTTSPEPEDSGDGREDYVADAASGPSHLDAGHVSRWTQHNYRTSGSESIGSESVTTEGGSRGAC